MQSGCQTYSWEMQLDRRPTTLWEMFDAIAGAGFSGVEFTNVTGGQWFSQPERVQAELAARKLTLVAVAVSRRGWTDPGGMADDLRLVGTAVELLAHFPGAILALGGAARGDRSEFRVQGSGPNEQADDWRRGLDQAIRFYTAAASAAEARGILACVHPHSHHGSIVQTQEQYHHLFTRLPEAVGWCPDTGHIVRGGLPLLPTLERYAARIGYIHLKDADAAGQWLPMGRGIIDFPALFAWLEGYSPLQNGHLPSSPLAIGNQGPGFRGLPRFGGWLVAEEESPLAWDDPAAANRANFEYLRQALPGAER